MVAVKPRAPSSAQRETLTGAALFRDVSTVEACSWIDAAVEVPPHGAKEPEEGKRKDSAEEGLSGEFKERPTQSGKSAQTQQRWNRSKRQVEQRQRW